MEKRTRPVRIGLVGPYPPPIGGVSIHVQRLKAQLETRGYECVVYDLLNQEEIGPGGTRIKIKGRKRWLLGYFFFAKEDIIHCHNSDWRLRAAVGLMGLLGKKTVISIHGSSLEDSLREGNWLKRQVIGFALRRASFVVAANSQVERLCLSLGVKPDRVRVIPSFIHPIVRDKEVAGVPQGVRDFIDSHTPVISANGFRVTLYNGQDLYGIDMCIDLCASLKNSYPGIGFVFLLPDIGDYDYFRRMKQRVRDKNIEDNFLFITQPLEEAYPLWHKSDIFVRPTATDGDAISLREALYLKIPSVASDVVPRPEGTTLFKNRDMEDFVSCVKRVWDDYGYYQRKLESLEVEDGLNQLLNVYSSLASKSKVGGWLF